MLTCFAGIALLLAAVGIYGVMADSQPKSTWAANGLRVEPRFSASSVTPASSTRRSTRRFQSSIGMSMTPLATAVGLQWMLDSSLRGLFYGAGLSEPVMLAGVAVVVTIAALLATWVPVRRATNVQPTVALRSE